LRKVESTPTADISYLFTSGGMSFLPVLGAVGLEIVSRLSF
jgi:hypothetical protein